MDSVLLSIEENWADEFYVFSAKIVEREVANKLIVDLQKITSNIEIWFGTNECLSWSNGEVLVSQIKIKELPIGFTSEISAWVLKNSCDTRLIDNIESEVSEILENYINLDNDYY